VLTTLFAAVKSRQSALIGETTVNFGDFFTTGEEHREVVAWMWSVLLSDGVRALTPSGRWAEALQHIQQHHGIGQRLFDGRQVAILAHHADGDLSGALDLLTDTSTPTAWEEAVAACLRTLCLSAADCPTASATTAMVDRYLTLEPDPEVRVFRVRLGLCIIDLAQHVEPAADVHRVMRSLESDARSAADAYIARDIVTHESCRSHASGDLVQQMVRLIHAAGLDQGAMPQHLTADLLDAVRVAESAARQALT
jgi:hypothetical protein